MNLRHLKFKSILDKLKVILIILLLFFVCISCKKKKPVNLIKFRNDLSYEVTNVSIDSYTFKKVAAKSETPYYEMDKESVTVSCNAGGKVMSARINLELKGKNNYTASIGGGSFLLVLLIKKDP
jgi:hypothetical protein